MPESLLYNNVADNTSVFEIHPNIKIIYKHANEDLNSIYKWLCTNKLSLNYAKIKYKLFQTAHSKPTPLHLLLQVNEKKIKEVREINFSGVTFNENLSWKTHMQKILGKIQSSFCAIRKIRPYLNKKHLCILYYSMIQSHINYCTTTWLHGNRTIASKIQKICNKFQKMLYIPSKQTKPPAKKLFNANDTKFTIYQTLIKKKCFIHVSIPHKFSPKSIL